jgi:hypothetical protein
VPSLPLPPRPDLDQLKRQAKELLERWKAASPDAGARPSRLRDAQKAVAERYGFASWDALRAHVEDVRGRDVTPEPRRRGLDYDDPVPDVTPWSGPMTRDAATRLAAQGVSGLKLDASTPADGLGHLRDVPSLRRLDLSGRDDLSDRDLSFLEDMPWLTAISLASCSRIGDGAISHLRAHRALEQVNLKWTATGDEALAALEGKPALHRLIVGARTTDAGAARLRNFPALAAPGTLDSFLSLSSARTLTDEALAHVGTLKGVFALDVHMSVFGSPHYTARGVAHLAGMAALEALNFHGHLATDAVLQEIARVPRLRSLHCQDIVSGDEGFAALGRCETLQALGARTCARLGARGLAAIARLPRLSHLSAGGPRLTDEGWAPIAQAQALIDLGPIMSRDGAFEYIGKIPRLERLANMYNRSSGDGATRHLRGHATLTQYSAFGTQITDESLRMLADLPRLESLDFENCAWITDEGMRELARAPRLRHVSAWSCKRVAGTWVAAMPAGTDAKSELPPAGQVEGYRAETLLDYPDLAIPPDVERLRAPDPSAGDLATLVPLGMRADWVAGGLQLSLDPGIDPRWVAAVTASPIDVPFRLEVVARPLTMMKLGFGGHNRFTGFDEHGALLDLAPWFLKTDAQKGRRHDPAVVPTFAPGEWTRVALEIDARGARLIVDGELRHSWEGAFASMRGRIGIGLPRAGVLTLREMRVTRL